MEDEDVHKMLTTLIMTWTENVADLHEYFGVGKKKKAETGKRTEVKDLQSRRLFTRSLSFLRLGDGEGATGRGRAKCEEVLRCVL